MITRVDMKANVNGVFVQQFEDGWTAMTPPVERHTNAETSLADMVAWFKQRGWTVREWPGGARAFRGQPMPVRTKGEILRLRRRIDLDAMLKRLPPGVQAHALDLAVDL